MKLHFFRKPHIIIYMMAHVLLVAIGLLLCVASGSNSLLFAVGGSIAATGFSGWVILFYVFATDNIRDRLDILAEFGFIAAFVGRSTRIRPEYEDRLARARDRIDVLGFGLSALREDFANTIATWKKYAKVRILLIDPEFPTLNCSLATQRDREEHNSQGNIATHVRQFVNATGSHVTQQGPFQIRLYKCLPTINIFRIDDELFWGPYLIGDQSRNSPTFIVARGGHLFARFSEHFERIWQSDEFSRKVPEEWLRATQ